MKKLLLGFLFLMFALPAVSYGQDKEPTLPTDEDIAGYKKFFTDAKADPNVQNTLGGIVTRDVSVDELVEAAVINQTLHYYRFQYEKILKKGEWDDDASMKLSKFFITAGKQYKVSSSDRIKEGQVLYVWMNNFANDAINVTEASIDSQAREDANAVLKDLGVEIGNDACGLATKKMDWFIYSVLPKYFSSSADVNDSSKVDFAEVVAEGLLNNVKENCPANYTLALADIYPVQAYVMGSSKIKTPDGFFMMLMELFTSLGLDASEMEFYLKTGISRDGDRNTEKK
ncbi:MAG: hypothetical protein V1647_01925 [Pseudomonadota bacterium]